jgi:hypothetical protein
MLFCDVEFSPKACYDTGETFGWISFGGERVVSALDIPVAVDQVFHQSIEGTLGPLVYQIRT